MAHIIVILLTTFLIDAQEIGEFDISYTPETLSSSGWINQGTLGTVNDLDSSSITGTITSIPTNNGDSDINALCFSYIQTSSAITMIDYDTNSNVRPDLTMEIWIYPTEVDATKKSWLLGHNDHAYDRAIVAFDPRFGGIAAGVGKSYASSVPYATTNEWTQVVVTWSKETSTAVIYKNGGTLSGGQQQTKSIVSDPGSEQTMIGLNSLTNYIGNNFIGCVAQVQITDRVVDEVEVQALYDAFIDVAVIGASYATDICLNGRSETAYVEEIGADNVMYCRDGNANGFPRYVASTSSGDAIMEYTSSILEVDGSPSGYTIYHEDEVKAYCVGVTHVMQCKNNWIVMQSNGAFVADTNMNTSACICDETSEAFTTTEAENSTMCSEDPPATFVWERMTEHGVNVPHFNYSMRLSEYDLSLNIHVQLAYLGNTSADDDGKVYGTTYVLDFESFDAHNHPIYEPGTCQNRISDSFYNDDGSRKEFSEWWKYSKVPALDGNIGEPGYYLAYPPTNTSNWILKMSDDEPCTLLMYYGHFTWKDLMRCDDGSGSDSYVVIKETASNITLSGIFYINIVSPVDHTEDSGFYRVYQLLSAPFSISVHKTASVLSEAGINVLTMSVIAVYKEHKANTFKLLVLTESQNYLALTRSENSTYRFISNSDSSTVITTGEFDAPETDEENGGCLSTKAFICSQLWEIKAENVDCYTNGIDFTGEYSLAFATTCRTVIDGETKHQYTEYCIQWLRNHPDIDSGVQLSAHLTWKDEVCDPLLFRMDFEAEMKFFTDAAYSAETDESYLYQVGNDTVYVEIDTLFPDKSYSVFDTTLLNVWLCTFDPLYEVTDPDATTASGGCFDAERDGAFSTEDNKYFYHIYAADEAIEEEGFVLFGHPDDREVSKNQIQFHFIVPSKIARDKLYVHAQVEVTLSSGDARRLLLHSRGRNSANQMNHFVGDVHVTRDREPRDENPVNKEPQSSQELPYKLKGNARNWTVTVVYVWFVVIGSVACLVVLNYIVCTCYVKWCSTTEQRNRLSFDSRRRSGYASVKDVDSADFHESELSVIDVSDVN